MRLIIADVLAAGHAGKVPGVPRVSPENSGSFYTFSTAMLGLAAIELLAGICVQSIPANSKRNCAGLSVSAPFCTAGQVKLPASSRFVTRQRPEPSQSSNLSRSVLLARNTNTSPANG